MPHSNLSHNVASADEKKSKTSAPKLTGLKQYVSLYIRHIKYYASFNKIAFLGQILFGVLAYAFYPIKVMVQALFVDSVIDYYTHQSFFHIFKYNLASPLQFLAIWLLLIVLKDVVNGIKEIFAVKMRNSIHFALSHRDLIPKIHKFNLQEVEKNDLFNKLETFNLYWWGHADGLVYRTIDVFGAIISMYLTFITIKNIPLWIILTAIGIPIIYILAKLKEDKKLRKFVESEAMLWRRRSYYISALTGIRTFMERKVNALHKYLNTLLRSSDDKLRSSYDKAQVGYNASLTFWNAYDKFVLIMLQFYVAAKSIVEGVKVGTIWANVSYVKNFYDKSLLLSRVIADIVNSLRYLKDLYDVYDMHGFAENVNGSKKIAELTKAPMLEFKNLTFKFNERSGYVFKNLNIAIRPDERVLVLGRDGAGKTALVKVLTTLFPVPAGRYFLDGVPVEQYARGEVKNIFSIIPEDFGRYYLPLYENILLGDKQKAFDKKQYDKALYITGLDKWIKKINLDERKLSLGTYFYPGIELSSGHWQRIAIARAIYRNRPVFILDQPFTYIDGASKDKIFKRFISYVKNNNKTLIYIGEDVDYIDYFDTVYEKFADGRLVKITKEQARKEWAGK